MFSMNRKDIPPHLLKFFEPRWTRKPKDDLMIPHRVFDALMNDGWYGRGDIVWHKPNPMPSSVTDRPTSAHEYVFLLTKSERYFYDADAIKEPVLAESVKRAEMGFNTSQRDSAVADASIGSGARARNGLRETFVMPPTRNRRSVWTVATTPSAFSHFAMFPQALIEPMVLAGCPQSVCSACGAPYERVKVSDSPRYSGVSMRNDADDARFTHVSTTLGWRATCSCAAATRPGIVYDPFMGSGTTALVAQRLGRHFVGTDINAEYVDLARTRLRYRGDDRRMMREQAAGVEQIALFEQEVA